MGMMVLERQVGRNSLGQGCSVLGAPDSPKSTSNPRPVKRDSLQMGVGLRYLLVPKTPEVIPVCSQGETLHCQLQECKLLVARG